MKQFIPFSKIDQNPHLIVDALHPNHLVFSHWKGANSHAEIASDTSGEISLQAIEQKFQGWDCSRISATHFDIDGFVGVFALFYPELALQHKEVLTEMAEIGDFRHFHPEHETSHQALKLCIWINAMEEKLFYRPFERRNEIEDCVPKFEYFLSHFPSVLLNVEAQSAIWRPEYEKIIAACKQIENTSFHADIDLWQVEAKDPLPYYALFANSDQADLVLSLYSNNRYELEYKYTTWIDLASRPCFPRLDLRPLAMELNQLEESKYQWMVEGITDTGPILRLEENKLSKADRFASPNERPIFSSSIDQESFRKLIVDYLRKHLKTAKREYFWTWEKLKKFNAS